MARPQMEPELLDGFFSSSRGGEPLGSSLWGETGRPAPPGLDDQCPPRHQVLLPFFLRSQAWKFLRNSHCFKAVHVSSWKNSWPPAVFLPAAGEHWNPVQRFCSSWTFLLHHFCHSSSVNPNTLTQTGSFTRQRNARLLGFRASGKFVCLWRQ